MTNEASTSNPSFIVKVGEVYPYPSHVIAPNFVTVKLSGKDTYNVWETQILCLLKSHQMNGFIDGQFPSPVGIGKEKVEEMQEWIISDSLVKGWILGSLSDGVAKKVVNRLKHKQKDTDSTAKDLWDARQQLIQKNTYFTAKELWDELQRSYGPLDCEQAAASTSNPSFIVKVGEVYPYPSHVSALNFITMKLGGKDTYNVWETQILCLLTSHQMDGFIDGQFPSPAGIGKGKVGLSDGVAKKVVNRLKHKQKVTDYSTAKDLWDARQQLIQKKTYFTAKELWDELQRSYGPSDCEQAAETKLTTGQAESVIEVISESEDAKSKDEPKEGKTKR
nr:ankyrin repeat-containing domain, PGG domain protein [Tanacetum cinerariifolium]